MRSVNMGREIGCAGVKRMSAAGLCVMAGAACAQPTVTALLYTETGSPLGVIPNSGGVRISSFTQAQLGLSRLGTRWVLAVNATGQPTTADTFVVSGTRDGADWSFAEGTAMPGIGFAITGRPNAQLGVNESGDVAMKVTTDAPAVSNEMVVRANRVTGDFTLIAREGTPVGNVAGETHSAQLDSVTLFDDGRVAYRSASTIGPLPSDQADFILLGDGASQTTIVQSGVFSPGGQFNGTTGLVVDFFGEAGVASDQSSHAVRIALGGVPAANSGALMVNRDVVLQTGAPVPGFAGEVVSSGLVDEARISPGGVWYAWGASASGKYYAVVNGQLYVKAGDTFAGAPGEELRSIGYMSINARGDIAYAADLTTIATNQRRTVIVLDLVDGDPRIVVSTFRSTADVSEGTRVDVDGDGVEDEAYVVFINDDTTMVSDAGEVYFVGRVVDGLARTRGDGLFVRKSRPCLADFNGDGFVDFFDFDDYIECFEGAACPPGRSADTNGDGFVDFFDLDEFVALFEAGC